MTLNKLGKLLLEGLILAALLQGCGKSNKNTTGQNQMQWSGAFSPTIGMNNLPVQFQGVISQIANQLPCPGNARRVSFDFTPGATMYNQQMWQQGFNPQMIGANVYIGISSSGDIAILQSTSSPSYGYQAYGQKPFGTLSFLMCPQQSMGGVSFIQGQLYTLGTQQMYPFSEPQCGTNGLSFNATFQSMGGANFNQPYGYGMPQSLPVIYKVFRGYFNSRGTCPPSSSGIMPGQIVQPGQVPMNYPQNGYPNGQYPY